MRPSTATAVILAGILLMLWRPWMPRGESSDPPSSGSPADLPPLPSDAPATPPAAPPLPGGPNVDARRSPLADPLNSPETTIDDDLATVAELFTHYRTVFGANPTGSNREITSALSGANPKLFAPLPPGHAAIDPQGHLVDRWQTPFFFHNISREFIEVRSAGPDRKLWTDDDVTTSNAPPAPQP